MYTILYTDCTFMLSVSDFFNNQLLQGECKIFIAPHIYCTYIALMRLIDCSKSDANIIVKNCTQKKITVVPIELTLFSQLITIPLCVFFFIKLCFTFTN